MTEDVLAVMQESDEPFLTAGEILAEVEVTRKTVHERLKELVEADRINRKKVGGRAVVFWLPERYQGKIQSPDAD